MFTLKIGQTDISGYVAQGGIEWSRNDIDGPNAGRGLDGQMIRDYVATKDKIKVTCRPLSGEELATLLGLLENSTQLQFHSVTYTNPRTNSNVTKTMHLSSVSAGFLLNRGDEEEDLWDGIAFNLIEK